MKQSNTMYSEVISLVQTTDDLDLLMAELFELRSAIYDIKDSFDNVLSNKVRRNVSELILKEMHSTGVGNKEYIEGLEKALKNLSTINITLAYEPDANSFAAIYQWFIDNVGKNIILDVYTNPNILGGVQISHNGKYYDGSILSKLNKVSRNRSKKVAE